MYYESIQVTPVIILQFTDYGLLSNRVINQSCYDTIGFSVVKHFQEKLSSSHMPYMYLQWFVTQ